LHILTISRQNVAGLIGCGLKMEPSSLSDSQGLGDGRREFEPLGKLFFPPSPPIDELVELSDKNFRRIGATPTRQIVVRVADHRGRVTGWLGIEQIRGA